MRDAACDHGLDRRDSEPGRARPGKRWHLVYGLQSDKSQSPASGTTNTRSTTRTSIAPFNLSACLGPWSEHTNIGFHAPPQEPGGQMTARQEPGYSSTPWNVTQDSSSITWNSETFAQNQNANAIRFGTLYNFRFDANQPPRRQCDGRLLQDRIADDGCDPGAHRERHALSTPRPPRQRLRQHSPDPQPNSYAERRQLQLRVTPTLATPTATATATATPTQTPTPTVTPTPRPTPTPRVGPSPRVRPTPPPRP